MFYIYINGLCVVFKTPMHLISPSYCLDAIDPGLYVPVRTEFQKRDTTYQSYYDTVRFL
jgi:hypothetical protein